MGVSDEKIFSLKNAFYQLRTPKKVFLSKKTFFYSGRPDPPPRRADGAEPSRPEPTGGPDRLKMVKNESTTGRDQRKNH